MACVPQFDTMHPSVSLGANFNDSKIPLNSNKMYKEKHIASSEGQCAFTSFSSIPGADVSVHPLVYSILKKVSLVPRSTAIPHFQKRTAPK